MKATESKGERLIVRRTNTDPRSGFSSLTNGARRHDACPRLSIVSRASAVLGQHPRPWHTHIYTHKHIAHDLTVCVPKLFSRARLWISIKFAYLMCENVTRKVTP